jgi:ribokinase
MATGVGFIILNESGENGIILDMAANKLIDPAFVDAIEPQIAASRVVMSVLELPVPAAARAMELGRKHGVCTILNPAPATPLDNAVLANVDYLTPNETELRILMGLAPNDPTPTIELARALKQRGVGTLIVTMGEKGALFLAPSREASAQSREAMTPSREVMVPAVSVDVVDTTGAGDAFNGGLAIALAEGRPLEDAVRYANCSGALACTALGVIPALGSRAAVDELYRRHYA